MVEGKTRSGYKFKIDERVITTWQFVEACKKMASKDLNEQISGAVDYIDTVLRDLKPSVIAHLEKKNDGFCSTEDLINETADIVNAIKESKNS